MTKKALPGSIILNHGRYWWQVKLPGNEKRESYPLKPKGSDHATTNLEVARAVAADLYRQHLIGKQPSTKRDKTLGSLMKDYITRAQTYYRRKDGSRTTSADAISNALRFLKPYAQSSPEDFGPLKLKQVQKAMIEMKLARKTINTYTGYVKAMFKWGVSEEQVMSSVYVSLTTVQNLHQGRSLAAETKKIKAVDSSVVRRILTHCSPTLAAMVELQMITGMRSTEMCLMRPIDLAVSGDVWLYNPTRFKMQYQGAARVIPLGPKSQTILKPFVDRFCPLLCQNVAQVRTLTEDAFIFSPEESERDRRERQLANRKTPMNEGNKPGSNKRATPMVKPGKHYTKDSYRKALWKAQEAAGIKKTSPLYFHPHQLRHTAGTNVRAVYDLDTSKALLGHSHVDATQIYAELDLGKAIKAAREIG